MALAAPVGVVLMLVFSEMRVEDVFQSWEPYVILSMFSGALGLAAFVTFRVVAAIARTVARRSSGAVTPAPVGVTPAKVLYVASMLTASVCLGALAFVHLIENPPDRFYRDHVGESLAARERFLSRYVDLPSGATSLRYAIVEYGEPEDTMRVEVVAKVAPDALSTWTRRCTPTSRDEVLGMWMRFSPGHPSFDETTRGLSSVDESTRDYYECDYHNGPWEGRVVMRSSATVVILMHLL